MFISVLAIMQVILLNEEVKVHVVHKLEVEVIHHHINPKERENLQNLKEMVDHRHLVQVRMVNRHRNKAND
jgi:hypothetical protein